MGKRGVLHRLIIFVTKRGACPLGGRPKKEHLEGELWERCEDLGVVKRERKGGGGIKQGSR